jgi:hypothetical protein
MHGGWEFPRVYDGAHLGMFVLSNAGARTFALNGHFTFIWG